MQLQTQRQGTVFSVFSGQLMRFCEIKFVCIDVPFYAFQNISLLTNPFDRVNIAIYCPTLSIALRCIYRCPAFFFNSRIVEHQNDSV